MGEVKRAWVAGVGEAISGRASSVTMAPSMVSMALSASSSSSLAAADGKGRTRSQAPSVRQNIPVLLYTPETLLCYKQRVSTVSPASNHARTEWGSSEGCADSAQPMVSRIWWCCSMFGLCQRFAMSSLLTSESTEGEFRTTRKFPTHSAIQ